METIIDLLKREFSNAGYTQLECECGILWKYDNGVDYWLVIDYLLDEEVQIDLYEKMSNFFKANPDAEKNTSILCAIKSNSVDIESIIRIENNVNYFKKYILVYTDETWSEIKDIVSEKSIADLVMAEDIFNSLKQGKNTLLYDIAHKLPQIMLNVQRKEISEIKEIDTLTPKMSDLLEWIQHIDSSNENLLSIVKQKANTYGTC